MQDKTEPKKKPTPGPSREAVEILKGVSKRAAESQAKKKPAPSTPAPPETLPDNWGLGDLVRVGKSRLKRAVYGPPKEGEK